MNRAAKLALVGFLPGVLAAGAPRPVQAQGPSIFVNTTEDLGPESTQCLPGQICPLRAAIGRAEGIRGVVRACYDPAEVGGGPGCPPGGTPLRTSDPGYDPETGRWTIAFGEGFAAFELNAGGTTVDFTQDVGGWNGPADDRIVIASGGGLAHAFAVQGNDNKLAGFALEGTFDTAAITVRLGASRNQLGPGLVIAGLDEGVGILIRDAESTDNRVVGSWCGLTGDGTTVKGQRDDCIQLSLGTRGNVVGGPTPADRNVLAASRLGVGVSVDGNNGNGTRDNTIQGNWIGLDAAGGSASGTANGGGIKIVGAASGTRVLGNVISGNDGPGIAIFDASLGTLIEENLIGLAPDGTACRPNDDYGIAIRSPAKDALVARNRIACNRAGGVFVSGGAARGHQLTANSITGNDGLAITLSQGANAGVQPAQIGSVSATEVVGQGCTGCTIEIFSDPSDEAATFEGRITVGAGLFRFQKPEGFRHANITTTATQDRSTSALSAPKRVLGGPTAVPSPSPSPTTGADLPVEIFMPSAVRT